jgi:hypothetical protein
MTQLKIHAELWDMPVRTAAWWTEAYVPFLSTTRHGTLIKQLSISHVIILRV